MPFYQCCRHLCSRSLFQFLPTSFTWLPGLPCQSCGNLSCDCARARNSCSLRWPNLDCRVDGRAVPSCSFELSAVSAMQCETLHCRVLLRTFFMKHLTKFVQCLNTASCIDHIPFFQKVNQYASLTIPKVSSHNFVEQEYCFHLLLFGWCGVMPFHALLFGLWKSLVDDSCQTSLFHKKFNDSMVTKRHVGDSHFLAVHYRNVRGVHALARVLILHSCWRGKMLLMVL